jgi:hypothetical protein
MWGDKMIKCKKISKRMKNRIAEEKAKCGDANRGKSWRLDDGKRQWFTKEGS